MSRDNDFEIYAYGPVHMSVCVAKTMSREDIELRANLESPTGISSRWEVSEDAAFRGGEPNPCQCEDDPDRLHYLMVC